MSRYNPGTYQRRSMRLPGYDYRSAGAYFVTICAHQRACLFGTVVDGVMRLSAAGQRVDRCWHTLPDHFPSVALDAWMVMPNHVHGVIVIRDGGGPNDAVAPTTVGARHAVPLLHAVPLPHAVPQHRTIRAAFGQPIPGSLSTIIRSFKSAATRLVNQHRETPSARVWQRGYYEHIIRDEASLASIRDYIATNPARWLEDSLNPLHPGGRHD